VPARIVTFDVVVMSQSCDLAANKVKIVLLCPFTELAKFDEGHWLTHPQNQEIVRRGNSPGFHMLAECSIPGYERGHAVVMFRPVYSAHIDYLAQVKADQGDRLRLLPPYREHLAQAFARFFMRVGLPQDIPPFR
jgi:hypothetical protein